MTLYPTFHGGLPYIKYADGSDGSDDDKNEDGTYDEWLKEQNTTDAVDPISNSVDRKIRSKLGPQAMGFFELYRQARLMHDGAPAPEGGLVASYRTEARILTRLLASKLDDRIAAPAINTLYDAMQDVKPWLQKIDQGYGTPTYRILGGKLALILVDVLTAAGIPVTTKPGADKTKWPSIRLMNRKQQQFEELRENHPDIAASIETNRETLRTQDGEVTGKITAAGLIPATTKIQGRLVQIGTDPATNEQLVYTRDGQVLSVAQFKESLGDTRKRDKRSVNLFPNGLPSGVKASPSLAGIRTLTDEQLADPEFIPDQEREPLPDGEEPVPGKLRPFLRIEYRALTDDAAAEPGTRVYPTKKDKSGRAVIVEGRFKGVYLDDIVNKAGRLIEGAAYDFDKDGKMVKFATKSPTGSKDVTANKEPYVTVDSKGRLLLKIPYSREYTQARTKVRALSAPRVPSIEAEPETNNTTFTFEPKDFPSIRRSIGGCVLSKPAADMIAAYFEQIGRQETALKEPALKNYTFDKIGGFKQIPIIDDATGLPRVTPPLYKDLFDKQKEALSWLESKGYSGVAALGTGVGKCVRGDTLIPTTRGLVPIRDLNPGLTVADTQAPVADWGVLVGGETVPVAAFYYAGAKPTLKVRTRNGYEIEGSLVHPVLVRGKHGETFTRLPDLKTGDFVCIERRDGDFPTEEPTLRVPEKTDGAANMKAYGVPERMNPELARLLGYIVAEGWVDNPRRFFVSQDGAINPEVNSDIVALVKSQFGYSLDASENDKGITSNFLRLYLEWMGVDYTVSADKCIPPVVLRSTKESVVQFIKAFVDAEGFVGESGLEVSSASERLLRELQVVLLRLGVVSSRNPKKVVGYDHTYWRLMITGDNLRVYRNVVGMVTGRKARMLDLLCERGAHTNTNVVPHAAGLVESLRAEISLRAGGQGKGGGVTKRFGATFVSTLKHIRLGRRNPTYAFMRTLLSVAEQVGVKDTAAFAAVSEQVAGNGFYDPIESITPGFCEVMDIMVDDPRHTFIGNGIVNHNTLLCIATIKKMDRDGFATDGQRFLYVCPNNLRGNFRKQAFEFLRDGNDVVGRTDVLTYGQFVMARKLNPAFGTKQGDPTKGFPQDAPASKALLTVIEGSDVAIPGYAALFFDEAHILTKNSKSKLSRATQSLNHPRKVMLTASPMEDDPEELYVAAAIANNVDLNPKRKRGEISQVVKDKMSFFRRYVQTVGGRAVGLKPNVPGKDPNKQDDFYAWAKTNVFSVNKRDIHEMKLPECNPTTVTVTMSPRVEAEYRKATQEIATTLKAAIAVAKSGKKPSSTKDFTNLFGVKLAGILKRISELSDMPGLLFPGERSPKVDQSAEIIRQSIGNGKRTLLFTDNPKFAEYTAQDISKQVPSLLHAVALSGKIRVFQDGAEVASYTARKYKWEDEEGKPTVIPKTLWASHILGTVLGQDPKVSSMTLTKTYAHGQNLQAFSVVVHLDRDSFSSEMIKQRTARAWRTGQKSTVSSVTLDAAYDTPKGGNDVTLDAIRGYIQAMQDKLFTEIVGNAQLAKIGPEWAEMQGIDASLVAVNRRLFELVVSPSPENIAAMESKS